VARKSDLRDDDPNGRWLKRSADGSSEYLSFDQVVQRRTARAVAANARRLHRLQDAKTQRRAARVARGTCASQEAVMSDKHGRNNLRVCSGSRKLGNYLRLRRGEFKSAVKAYGKCAKKEDTRLNNPQDRLRFCTVRHGQKVRMNREAVQAEFDARAARRAGRASRGSRARSAGRAARPVDAALAAARAAVPAAAPAAPAAPRRSQRNRGQARR